MCILNHLSAFLFLFCIVFLLYLFGDCMRIFFSNLSFMLIYDALPLINFFKIFLMKVLKNEHRLYFPLVYGLLQWIRSQCL